MDGTKWSQSRKQKAESRKEEEEVDIKRLEI
jgi:hypothetical protein